MPLHQSLRSTKKKQGDAIHEIAECLDKENQHLRDIIEGSKELNLNHPSRQQIMLTDRESKANGRREVTSLEREQKQLEEKMNLLKNRVRVLEENEDAAKKAIDEFREKKCKIIEKKLEKIEQRELLERQRNQITKEK
jgi:hypothetical protein